MSLKNRVKEIATGVAVQIANQVADIRFRQQTQLNATMGVITAVSGNLLTITLSTGDSVTVANIGGRNVGVGDAVATDGKNVAF